MAHHQCLVAKILAYLDVPPQSIVVGPAPLYHHGVVGLNGIEDQAGRAFLHRPDIHIYVAQHAREYYEAPAVLRLDTRTMAAQTASPAQRMANGTTMNPQ